MLRHVTGQPADFLGQLAQLLPERRVLAAGKTGKVLQFVRQSDRPTVRQLCNELDFTKRQVERFPDFADRGAQAIRGEGADEPRVLGAVARVYPADQLLADLAREVEIDVGY